MTLCIDSWKKKGRNRSESKGVGGCVCSGAADIFRHRPGSEEFFSLVRARAHAQRFVFGPESLFSFKRTQFGFSLKSKYNEAKVNV